MKKIVSVMLAGVLLCGALNAQSIKVTNTFGGDSDNISGSDLFVFENQKDEEGSYENEFGNKTRVSDRLQLDASVSKFDSRIRIEFNATKLNGKDSTVRFRGYGRFKPVDQFQLIAGNDFFTKVPVDAGYLVASDDYPKYARILQNGFGAISGWTFGEEKNINLTIASGLKGADDTFLDMDSLGFDAGLNFGIKNVFSAGASFQNMTGNNFSVAAFAGLNSVENLTLNAGYIYNATDTDFITKPAKNALSVTVGYNFKKIGLFASADVISALGNEYIDDGETKDYKDGNDDLIPFLSKMNVSYKISDSVTVGTKAKIAAMLGERDSTQTEIYPNVTYTLPKKLGSITSGVRLSFDADKLAKFAIPLSWKCTFIDLKK